LVVRALGAEPAGLGRGLREGLDISAFDVCSRSIACAHSRPCHNRTRLGSPSSWSIARYGERGYSAARERGVAGRMRLLRNEHVLKLTDNQWWGIWSPWGFGIAWIMDPTSRVTGEPIPSPCGSRSDSGGTRGAAVPLAEVQSVTSSSHTGQGRRGDCR